MFFHLVMVAGDTPSCAPSSLRVNIYFCGMNAKYHVFCICQIGWQGGKIKAEGKGGKRRENRIANKWEKAGKGGKRREKVYFFVIRGRRYEKSGSVRFFLRSCANESVHLSIG